MRTLCLSLALFLVSGAPALALDGVILDQRTGRPVPNADVSILGLTGSVKTDAAGRFSWRPDPKPPFEVLVILSNGTMAKPILIETLEGGVFTVRIDAAVAEQITVSGAAPSIDASPAAGMTSVSGRDIEVRSPENLVQALENVAGLNQVSDGHAGVPAVRGLASGRTLLLIDGGRVNAERRIGPSATYLDPSTLDGVDVARGPGSVAYGSDAFGGVISARTRRAEAGDPLRVRFLGTLGAGVPEGRGSAEIGKGFSKGGVFFQAHYRNAEDWNSPEGTVFNSGWHDYGVLARTTHVFGSSHLSLGSQSDFGRDIERPRNNSSTVRFFYPEDTSHRFTANYKVENAGVFGRLAIDGLFSTYRNITDQDRFATPASARSVERADVRSKDYQVRAVSERLLGDARLMTGLDINGRYGLDALDISEAYDLAGALTSTRENVSVDDAHRRDAGAFLQFDAAVASRVVVSGGGRFDYVTTENPGGFFPNRSTSNNALSGFVSAAVGPFAGLTFTGQISRGFRDPVLSDRYFRGPSGRGFITGNPDLDPETSLQFDGAARYTAGHMRLGVNAYHYGIEDLIERFGAGDNFFFRNRGEATIRGIEGEVQATLPHALSLELTAQLARGEDAETDAALDSISPATFTALVRKTFGTRTFTQARIGWFGEDARPGPTERLVNGYTLLDLSGGVRLIRQLEIRVQMRNLLDETHFASQDARAVLAPGRSASITFAAQF
ncbi:MAG: TonB-dependent receptor [Acidobacteriota bacterium]|nr:TonB-dependent receptor [Acidobacteriota bacterium]